MNLLLDTHIWIWSVASPAKLISPVRRALESKANHLWLSPLSVWEMMILVEKGKLHLGTTTNEWIAKALAEAPMKEAPVTFEIARESRSVDLKHQDPVDRFLAATARVLQLTLVTSDKLLIESSGFAVMSNRTD